MKIGRNDPCWCGSGKKYKACHAAFDDKLAEYKAKRVPVPSHKLIKTKEQLEGIELAEEKLYLGRLYERSTRTVDFSVIKCYLLHAFEHPEKTSNWTSGVNSGVLASVGLPLATIF